MQYGSFRGRDVAEAIHAVKAAYGADALIGETRRVLGEEAGGLALSYVEVDAAPPPFNREARRGPFSNDIDKKQPSAPPQAARPSRPRKIALAGLDDAPSLSVSQELIELRSLVEQLTAAQPTKNRVLSVLYESGIEGGLATRIASQIAKQTKDVTDAEVRDALRERLLQDLSAMPSPIAQRGRVGIAVVGPTGVGKTTTVAKLAARAAFDLGKSVTLITTDTYRVGAVEQIQKFADLIGITCHVAPDPETFSRIMASSPSDIVLVDTGGGMQPAVTSKILSILGNQVGRKREVLLTLSAQTRGREAERIALGYAKAPISGLVITKTDETQVAGGVVHAITRGPYPVAYVCNGPRVPEDIADANVDELVSLLVREST